MDAETERAKALSAAYLAKLRAEAVAAPGQAPPPDPKDRPAHGPAMTHPLAAAPPPGTNRRHLN